MKDNVYTQKNYTKLLDTLKNIRQKSLEKTNQNKEHIQKIYDALNIIEKECEFKPSYKNFINKIISDENLKKAKPNAELVIIKNMNHILKDIQKDEDNFKSYTNPDFPISKQLIQTIVEFVKK